MPIDRIDETLRRVQALAADFHAERDARARRTALDPEDFRALAAAGWLLTGVPAEAGGLWRGVARSARDYCELLRSLARADPSLALVASMHPAVLAFWLAVDRVDTDAEAWRAQREQCFDSARAGHFWGTVISEPGSGGDPARTRAVARAAGNHWSIHGEKHFGSGAGVVSFMITTAVAEGEEAPDLFFVDMRGRPWDGSAGLTLRRAWDGHGMMATQSHAFRFDACAATRAGSREGFPRAAPVVGQLAPLMFTAVILGVLDEARASARTALAPKWRELRAFEQVAWTESANRMWLAEQAYEGALRAVESGRDGPLAAARAKLTVAELAESSLATVSRVVGGSSYSKSQLFGQWAQDVRALGFLRPPWGYAYDQLLGLDLTPLTASP